MFLFFLTQQREEEFTLTEEQGLAMHNEFRQIHQGPAMTLNKTMCNMAQAYAETLAQSGTFQHSSSDERDGDGENLSFGCATEAAQTVDDAVTNWSVILS